jgi:hypothetical protein
MSYCVIISSLENRITKSSIFVVLKVVWSMLDQTWYVDIVRESAVIPEGTRMVSQLVDLDFGVLRKPGVSAPSRRTVPDTRVCLLTNTTKMPGFSWGIPAVKSCPFSKFGAGSICGACYARPNREQGRPTFYGRSNVKRAQAVRFSWIRECLKTENGRGLFISTIVTSIRKKNKKNREYFRIHDSGDFYSEKYVRCWIEICKQLPDTKFWAPTRSYKAEWVECLRELNSLPNVTVRPSADMFDDQPPVIEGLAAGSTSHTPGGGVPEGCYECPAYKQGGNCVDCRVCWDLPLVCVSYKQHIK